MQESFLFPIILIAFPLYGVICDVLSDSIQFVFVTDYVVVVIGLPGKKYIFLHGVYSFSADGFIGTYDGGYCSFSLILKSIGQWIRS